MKLNKYLPLLSLFLLTVVLRLPLLGMPPSTDEGIYAAHSWFMFANYTSGTLDSSALLPSHDFIQLYPLLVSWVYALPLEPFFTLRFIDALVAGLATVAIYLFLRSFSEGRIAPWLAAAIFAFAYNNPIFIDAGFKNSIGPATALLFTALLLIRKKQLKFDLVAGALIGVMVLTREAFLGLAIVCLGYAWLTGGRAVLLRIAGAAVGSATTILLLLLALRGGWPALAALYDTYAHSPYADATANRNTWRHFVLFGPLVIKELAFILPLAMIGLAGPLLRREYRSREPLTLYGLSVALALIPLVEPLLKSGYPYHFAQAMFGIVILTYVALTIIENWILRVSSVKRSLATFIVGVALAAASLPFAASHANRIYGAYLLSRHFAPVMIHGDWSNRVVADSFYLANAAIIRRLPHGDGRMLVSGYNTGLYALTRRLPPNLLLEDLNRYIISKAGRLSAVDRRYVIEQAPQVFVRSGRRLIFQSSFDTLANELINAGYRRVATIRKGRLSYGGYSSIIYFRPPRSGATP